MNMLISIFVLLVLVIVTFYNIIKAKLNVKDIVLIGLFTALMVVGAWLKVLLPYIPVTMQLFFSIMSGVLLGSRLGLLSQLVYILIGLIGFPAFAGGAGLSYVFQPSFGYLIGFVLGAFVAGKIIEKSQKNNLFIYIVASLTAMLVIYAVGVPYLYIGKNFFVNSEAAFSIWSAIKYGFLMFLGKDIASCLLLAVVSLYTRRALAKSGLITIQKA